MSVGDDFHVQLAMAGAVEFGEEYFLPAAEREAPPFDEHRFGGADERGLDMRIGISFGVAELRAIGYEAVESAFHVMGDIGIIALVDKDAGGGVRNVEMADAGRAAGFANKFFDFRGDIF